LIGVLAWLAYQERIDEHMLFGLWNLGPVALHPLSLMYFLSGSAMISTIRVPKL
jgi:CDP-diacylglycerol--serine O-phosphatidyltransferase